MKHAVHIAALVTLAAGAVFGQQSGASSTYADDLREIQRLEAEWNRINEVSDAEGKARLLSEDSYHVGPSGRLYNKAQDIEAMISSRREKQASSRSLRFLISDMRIRLYHDVAVVTATGTSINTRDGQSRRGASFRAIHVWEKVDGVWFLAVDQVTGIANTPAAQKQ
jgi:uncharacterized protein (TIGR02246 family)